ncbi:MULTISPECIES: hypothetical protein [Moorena]|uniref:hypothetical protein n=1 Tax=Moorena TaxID=1155738 RepID=UPI00030EAC81|nr:MULTISPECIES: hypothetical protein [Moorena]NEP64769.1 hypothetical protein [Moorena sp. SIO3A5]NER87554.1 hypothetical protein [Moorena sp. SIO3A2]
MRSLFLDQSRETQQLNTDTASIFPAVVDDTRHPTPDTRHPTPDTRHPTPYSLLPTPYSLLPTP